MPVERPLVDVIGSAADATADRQEPLAGRDGHADGWREQHRLFWRCNGTSAVARATNHRGRDVTELWSMISERRAWDPRPPAVMVARIVFAFCCAAPLIWLVSNMLATGARALAQ
jgi:hypothetical protein